MTNTTLHQIQTPASEARAFFEKLMSVLKHMATNLEEADALTTISSGKQLIAALTRIAREAERCQCRATGCSGIPETTVSKEPGCPQNKDVPRIMDLIKEIGEEGIKALNKELGPIMDRCNANLVSHGTFTEEDYWRKLRKGHMQELKAAIQEASSRNPAFEKALERLKKVYDLQTSSTAHSEFMSICNASCEDGCTLLYSGHKEVGIRETEFDVSMIGCILNWVEEKFKLPGSVKQSGKTAIIVGAGPSGLDLAQELAKQGHRVIVIDKQDEVGGLLYRGIPDHKFAKDRLVKYRVLAEEITGIEFRLGKEADIGELLAHAASGNPVFVCPGVMHKDCLRKATFEGADALENAGILRQAYDMLCEDNERVAKHGPDTRDAAPVTSAVFGGGLTAADCVTNLFRRGITALKEGCSRFVLNSDRNPLKTEGKNMAGAGWPGNREMQTDWSTVDAEMRVAQANALQGSYPVKGEIEPGGKSATITFRFQKPKTSGVAKQYREYEQDQDAGDIRLNGKVIGTRLRDKDNVLRDYPVLENGRLAQEPLPIGKKLEGTVDGTAVRGGINEIAVAYGSEGPYNNPLFKAMGIIDIKNSQSNIPNVLVAGDAENRPDKWFLVNAQESGQRAAKQYAYNLTKPELTWEEHRKDPVVIRKTAAARAAAVSMSLREEVAQSL